MENPRIYGILGHNISYSLSTLIYNTVFMKRGLPFVYKTFDVARHEVKDFVSSVRMLGISGFNVTIPYKEYINDFVDEIDKSAAGINALNLVLNSDRTLIGYNTDISGIKATIEEKLGLDLKGLGVGLIGAGGAAQAILAYLESVQAGPVVIFNRTLSKADTLALNHALVIEKRPLSNIRKVFKDCDLSILINATPLLTEAILDDIPPGIRIFDLKYRSADDCHDNSISNGIYMLASQARANLKLFCGIDEPLREIIATLGRRGL